MRAAKSAGVLALSDSGPVTFPELAAKTGTHERYAREWLEQQAAAGILEVDDADEAPEARRYSLPPGESARATCSRSSTS